MAISDRITQSDHVVTNALNFVSIQFDCPGPGVLNALLDGSCTT